MTLKSATEHGRGLSCKGGFTANEIQTVQSQAFIGLDSLGTIRLRNNKLRELSPGIFGSLPLVYNVSVENNLIDTVHPGALADIKASRVYLNFKSNQLTTLPWTAFIPQNGTGSVNLPLHLNLDLSKNPLLCNESICWVKQGWTDGWISYWFSYYNRNYPECTNYPNTKWEDITIDCTNQGKYALFYQDMLYQ